nr:MAG TPA: hypothetical protein [Caudoviricetes sp.]
MIMNEQRPPHSGGLLLYWWIGQTIHKQLTSNKQNSQATHK